MIILNVKFLSYLKSYLNYLEANDCCLTSSQIYDILSDVSLSCDIYKDISFGHLQATKKYSFIGKG